MLCFLNELDFTDNINNDQIEKLRCVKQRLVIEFDEKNACKLIDALNFFDQMSIIFMVINLDARLEKTNSLQELILYLISFNNFVDTNEHVIEY